MSEYEIDFLREEDFQEGDYFKVTENNHSAWFTEGVTYRIFKREDGKLGIYDDDNDFCSVGSLLNEVYGELIKPNRVTFTKEELKEFVDEAVSKVLGSIYKEIYDLGE
jgi:hypothetical protein|nr:MAG TPA: hypothetical protein [Caudoviricetes sp.]